MRLVYCLHLIADPLTQALTYVLELSYSKNMLDRSNNENQILRQRHSRETFASVHFTC